jgi:hypothetical protein
MTSNARVTFAQSIEPTLWSAFGALVFGGLLPLAIIVTMFQA